MKPVLIQKECLTCNKILRGRSDKKFCNDYCRNVFNNNLKGETQSVVRKVNTLLMKNRRIALALLNENQTVKVKKVQLEEFGFRFQYCTHRLGTQKGQQYFFCYDVGYLPLQDDWILLVKQVGEWMPALELRKLVQ